MAIENSCLSNEIRAKMGRKQNSDSVLNIQDNSC